MSARVVWEHKPPPPHPNVMAPASLQLVEWASQVDGDVGLGNPEPILTMITHGGYVRLTPEMRASLIEVLTNWKGDDEHT
jgi:hypothetical protein